MRRFWRGKPGPPPPKNLVEEKQPCEVNSLAETRMKEESKPSSLIIKTELTMKDESAKNAVEKSNKTNAVKKDEVKSSKDEAVRKMETKKPNKDDAIKKVETKPSKDDGIKKVETKPSKGEALNKVETKPHKDAAIKKVDTMPSKDKAVNKVETTTSKDDAIKKVDTMPSKVEALNNAIKKVETKPSKDAAIKKVDTMPSKDKAVNKVETTTSNDDAIKKVEIKPSTDDAIKKVETKPSKDEAVTKVDTKPSKDESVNKVETKPSNPPVVGKKCPAAKKAPPMKAPLAPPTKAGPKAKAAPTIIGRKLHWDALQGNAIQGTVFQELTADMAVADANMLDVESMKRIFAGAAKKEAKVSRAQEESDAKRKIIPGSRAQNVAIALSRLGQPVQDIADKIEKIDSSGLERELLDRLADLAPTADELKGYAKFIEDKEDFETLRDIEKKFWPFYKITRMKEKCRVLSASIVIPEYIAELKTILDLLYEGGRQVRKSQKFRAFLVAVLLWGNFVNYGVEQEEKPEEKPATCEFGRRTRRSGTAGLEIKTYGFTLPSLLKLAEFKTTLDPTISSLHFIVANMMEAQPHVEVDKMCEEMSAVADASKITASSIKEIFSNIHEIRQFGCIIQLTQSLHQRMLLTTKEIVFLEAETKLANVEEIYGSSATKISELLKDAKQKSEEAKTRFDSVAEFIGETAAYFGNAAAKSKPDAHEEFFKTLLLFLTRFQSCVTDYSKNLKKFQNVLVESAVNKGITDAEEGQESKSEEKLEPATDFGPKVKAKAIKPHEPKQVGKSHSEGTTKNVVVKTKVQGPLPKVKSSTVTQPKQEKQEQGFLERVMKRRATCLSKPGVTIVAPPKANQGAPVPLPPSRNSPPKAQKVPVRSPPSRTNSGCTLTETEVLARLSKNYMENNKDSNEELSGDLPETRRQSMIDLRKRDSVHNLVTSLIEDLDDSSRDVVYNKLYDKAQLGLIDYSIDTAVTEYMRMQSSSLSEE